MNDHIGHPDKNLGQAIRRFIYVLEKFGINKNGLGITSHGLRHQHLNDIYEQVTGVPSPERTGSLSSAKDQRTHDLGRMRVSQDAGHSRLSISGAYIGSRPAVIRTELQKAEEKRKAHLLGKEDLNAEESAELIALVRKEKKAEAGLIENSGGNREPNLMVE